MLEADQYFLQKEEPVKSCLLALRAIVLSQDKEVSLTWKYRMPFFTYKGKMFCYLWVHKKTNLPYLGLVEGLRLNHPDLIREKRSRMKILLLDPHQDLPLVTLETLLQQAIHFYKSGEIKIK